MASRSSSAKGLSSAKACTECRQAKLRCDSREKFPSPCSRCQARRLYCTIDASFRRTPARKRLEAMSRELQELRSQRDGDHSATQSELAFDSGVSPEHASEDKAEDNFELDEETLFLNGTLVEPPLAIRAFKAFAELFRPQLPIIGPISMMQTYHSEPFLFWTIVIIVSSHLPEFPNHELYDCIQEPYKQLLKDEILEVPLPLHKIQALLFLCVWPLPVDVQPRDPSWLYCGIAVHSARYMGLDREEIVPSLRSLGVASGRAQARINTWLACFYVGTSLSMHLGLPPPIDGDLDFAILNTYLGRNTLTSDFAARIRVQLVVAKFTTLLMHEISESASSSVTRLLDSEFDVLMSNLSQREQGGMVEFSMTDARLHFYALSITRTQPSSSYHQITLKTAFAVALRTIHIAASRTCSSSLGNTDYSPIQKQRSLPKNYYRGIAFATVFLLRFFHQNGNASLEEQQATANHIVMAQEVFRSCSTEPLDEYNRTAKLFERLARSALGTSEPVKLRLTHRMGVSILLDSVSIASELRGQPVEIGEHETLRAHSRVSEENSANSEPSPDRSHTSEQIFLGEFWGDPMWDMLNLEALPLRQG